MRITLETLGCKLNQAETELLARDLATAGHDIVAGGESADVCIVNTCTVTEEADRKSRQLLGTARRRNPRTLVVATGCYAERAAEDVAKTDGVGLVVGNQGKARLAGLLAEIGYTVNGTESTPLARGAAATPGLRTRSLIKIQDGCGSFCGYCVVPLVRETETSLPMAEIIREIRRREADGYREVVLTGTKVGTYRHEGTGLDGLLATILAETSLPRLRLSSLQPQEISYELLEQWRDRRLCPHFHLSLQSGSDTILHRMKRGYRTADYERAVAMIRDRVVDVAITTDVITGFPGETDDEFEESREFCRRMEFARIHVFPYSLRAGTAAASMPGQVSASVKKQRSNSMLALAEKSAVSFRARFTGTTRPVLWEQRTSGSVWNGLTDNYIRVWTKSNEELGNRVVGHRLKDGAGQDAGSA